MARTWAVKGEVLMNFRERRRQKRRTEGTDQGKATNNNGDVSQATAECLREEPRNANGEYINEHLAFLQGENSLPGEYSLI